MLAQEGFTYDSSQHDSPRIRGRVLPASAHPHALELDGAGALWEFPLAVWHLAGGRLPVGGASYWAVMPTGVVLRGLSHAGDMAGLYLHPHELDPQPLRVGCKGARGRLREAQRNLARRRAGAVLRAIAREHRLMTYGEAHAQLSGGAGARPQPLSR